jgi:hypothetical protein
LVVFKLHKRIPHVYERVLATTQNIFTGENHKTMQWHRVDIFFWKFRGWYIKISRLRSWVLLSERFFPKTTVEASDYVRVFS